MWKNKRHLIPPIIEDMAEKLTLAKHSSEKQNYIERFEVIKSFCEHVLTQISVYKNPKIEYNKENIFKKKENQ